VLGVGWGGSPDLSFARWARTEFNFLAQPFIDDGSDAGIRRPGALRDQLGDVGVQVDRDVQFDIRAVELPAFPF